MNPSSNSAVCDLCGCDRSEELLNLSTGRAMLSDRRLTGQNLVKHICPDCGLVFSAEPMDESGLLKYYTEEYTLSTQPVEHFFHTPAGPVARSAMLADWLTGAFGVHGWLGNKRILEVGAGQGLLLKELSGRFAEARFEGLELNASAASIGQSNGLAISQSTVSGWPYSGYDLIYSVAVVEHVPSPTAFLMDIRKKLRLGGLLFLCQPTQDVESYDLFFVDHLHHFSSAHLRGYAGKCGFTELGCVVGHPWMPNFSLHIWKAVDIPDSYTWEGPPALTACRAAAYRVTADMKNLDALLMRLKNEGRRVAAFGLNEVFWLTRAYSRLGEIDPDCGFDDTPDKPEYRQFRFPVVTPEEGAAHGITDVLLTMNRIYYTAAVDRINRLGIKVHPVLS